MNNNYSNINFRNINENAFWLLTEKSNWGELTNTLKTEALEHLSNYLIDNYSLNEIVKLQHIEVSKREEIMSIIDAVLEEQDTKLEYNQKFNLASHIVGLGKTVYEYVKDNPNDVMTLNGDNVVCFEDGFDQAIYKINYVES